MTDSIAQTAAEVAAPGAPAKAPGRFAAVQPVLEQLFTLYPQLFGQRFVPLKLGVFQELLAAHPDTFQRDTLRAALGVHTRSTRYLQCVAQGLPRHDLQGRPVEPVAPEHVFQAIVDLYQRRRAREPKEALERLSRQLKAAYAASGLPRQDYLTGLPPADDAITAVLDEAVAQVDQQRARTAALARALALSGQSEAEFADALGMTARQLKAALRPV